MLLSMTPCPCSFLETKADKKDTELEPLSLVYCSNNVLTLPPLLLQTFGRGKKYAHESHNRDIERASAH